MIPLPQTPWTLAIAELLDLQMQALGSGTQPADVLANLLPNCDPLPDGWLERFLAGTPVPDWRSAAVYASPNGPSAAATANPGQLPSALGPVADALANVMAPPQPDGLPKSSKSQSSKEQFTNLWEETLKCIALAAQAEAADISGSNAGADQESARTDASSELVLSPSDLAGIFGGGPPPRPPSGAPIAGDVPDPRRFTFRNADPSADGESASSPGSGNGSSFVPPRGKQVGDELRVLIDLVIDSRQISADLLKLAKQVAEQVVGRHQVRMGAQDRANCWGHR